MFKYMRGDEEYVKLRDVQERVDKQLEEFYQQVCGLRIRVQELEAEAERLRLQALIDEYRKFGGTSDYEVLGTNIRECSVLNPLPYLARVASTPTYTREQFRGRVLVPQKAAWAETHSCRASDAAQPSKKGGRK